MNQEINNLPLEGSGRRNGRIELKTTSEFKKRLQDMAAADGKTTTRFLLEKASNPTIEHRLAALEKSLKEKFAELHDEIIMMQFQILETLGYPDEVKSRVMTGEIVFIDRRTL